MLTLLRRFSLFIGLILIVASPVAAITNLPDNFTETVFTGGVDRPTTMRFAPDGRLFVLEQDGKVWIVEPNGNKTEGIDLNVDGVGERGLLGIAFDPNFASNNYVYLYYTVPNTPRFNRISRFTLTGTSLGSEFKLMDLDPLSGATNHNGGAMNFGADGKLYIAVGDNATASNSQTLNNRHGKILRINSDGSIPNDNPFYTEASGENRSIWALGLRNPFNFDVQPGTGKIYLNDVGAGSWEEINEGIAGANYGWPDTEGDFDQSEFPNYTRPLYAYSSKNDATGEGCSIIGAAFYNPTTVTFPTQFVGDYFFGDYCADWIRHYDSATDSATEFAAGLTGGGMVDMVVSEAGDLYYLSRNSKTVYRITYQTPQSAPVITQEPQSVTVATGASATFTCDATGNPAPTFKWQRNGEDIPNATEKSYTIEGVTQADNGATFRCIATNTLGSDTSEEATLTVTANTIPTATITTPTEGTKYNAGQTISYSGTGIDTEDGTLPASAFTWEVVFHHADHTHPFIAPFSGVTEGTFEIPRTGHTETDVWYRIRLTVTDAEGATHTVTRDIFPNVVSITINTEPPGLQITLDGQPRIAPYTEPSVVGVTRTIGVQSPQTMGDVTYVFQSWSDTGTQSHDINTPETDTTYTAIFTAVDNATDLLANGDFEAEMTQGWQNKGMTGAKRVCNKPEKTVAHSGDCAFQTKGRGSTGRLQQNIGTVEYGVGATLDLSLWAEGKNIAAGARVQAKVKYVDGSKDTLLVELPTGTYAYQALSDNLTLTGEVDKIKVQIRNGTTGGRLRLDLIQLTAYNANGGRLLELPQ
jgi:glucose/arabinose dehydrogenase